MTGKRVYLDQGSSAPLHPAARRAMESALDAFGDPMRIHAAGRRSRELLDRAREGVGAALGAQPDEVVFTSGGTESVALALRGAAEAMRDEGNRVVVSAVEHPSVLGTAAAVERDGFEVETVPVDEFGRLDADSLSESLRKPGTILASVQHTNHEVGTLQPVAEAIRLSKEAGVVFHMDACQAAGRLPLDFGSLAPDLLSISGHKFGGPAGIGALLLKRGTRFAGYPGGDDRERRRRSGMENLIGAEGMAAALESAVGGIRDAAADQWSLTELIRTGVGEFGGIVYGHPTQRAPHLVCFSIDELDPEVLLMALDERGFELGGGSVATGVTHEASSVLDVMGYPGVAPLRVGIGGGTTAADVGAFLEALSDLTRELRRMQSASSDVLSRSKDSGRS